MDHFLPLVKVRSARWDRLKTIEVPVFPGYLFARFDPKSRVLVATTPGLVSIVSRGPVPIEVEEREITAVQRVVEAGLSASPWPYLSEGDRVRVQHGVLSGLEGILVRFENQYRLIVCVTILQRSVAVDIDRALVRPIE